ncbi:MAG: DMT family transporter [Candidatus Krumholzibacteria bacterium]|nr:DMT family transporter [Candidatus Krumholzibacteria bacterium]
MTGPASRTTLPLWAVRLLMVLLFIIWANAFTAIKQCREMLPPMELVLARFLPVALLALAWLLSSRRRLGEAREALRAAPLRLAAMGLTGVAGYNYFIFLAQTEIKPGAAALLTTLSPLFTLILATVFLRERVPLRRIIGIAVAFAGLFFVVRWGRIGLGRVTDVPNAEMRYTLIAAAAPLCWSLYTILGKDLVRTWSPAAVTGLPILIGTIPLLPLATPAFFGRLAGFGWTHWASLLYLSVMSTIVGFFIWNYALRRLPATSTAAFIYLNPPFAALFGWLLFGEEITGRFLAGSAVVLLGLWMTQHRSGS